MKSVLPQKATASCQPGVCPPLLCWPPLKMRDEAPSSCCSAPAARLPWGCSVSWWLLVVVPGRAVPWEAMWHDRLPDFLCRYLSAVVYQGIDWSVCALPTGSLAIFFLGFFTRSSFTSEGLEEWEDVLKAGCSTSSKAGPTGACVSVPACSEL